MKTYTLEQIAQALEKRREIALALMVRQGKVLPISTTGAGKLGARCICPGGATVSDCPRHGDAQHRQPVSVEPATTGADE